MIDLTHRRELDSRDYEILEDGTLHHSTIIKTGEVDFDYLLLEYIARDRNADKIYHLDVIRHDDGEETIITPYTKNCFIIGFKQNISFMNTRECEITFITGDVLDRAERVGNVYELGLHRIFAL